MDLQSTPLISIVLPAKNAEEFLVECLDSILQQSYTNWELNVINDHSDDNTAGIVATYVEGDSRIHLHQADGNGIISALQQAYANSKGEYITRMDADDIMPVNKLRTLYKNLQRFGRGHLATGCVSYFSTTGVQDGYRSYEQWLNGLTAGGENYKEIYKECVIPSPCWMLHTEDFEKCGAFNDETYPEDYHLCFRFYKADMKVIPSKEVLHLWRDHPYRTSRTHEHYADNSFLRLKVGFFLELDNDVNRPLAIWGAGKRSKEIARLLQDLGIAFQWVCNNPKKIGHVIYGVELQDHNDLDFHRDPQVIIAVANPADQLEIRTELEAHDRKPGKDDFFFC